MLLPWAALAERIQHPEHARIRAIICDIVADGSDQQADQLRHHASLNRDMAAQLRSREKILRARQEGTP